MNPSTALATVLIEALAQLGVRHLVLCPGSRSAPLAYAAIEAEAAGLLQVHVRLDERGAGFLALGLAKEDGVPAAVVTTSGTAVANLHPAVLEASHAGVPLIVLSADRPHELRGTGASQTTDQVRIFGPAVRLFAEIPAPERRAGQVAGWRGVAARAFAAATGALSADPGPVQLNVALRDPLVPDDASDDAWPEPLTGHPVTRIGLTHGFRVLTERLTVGPRTVVVAGDGAGPDAARLAEQAGLPLLAEPSSGSRTGSAVGPYRLLLDVPHLGRAIERVIVFGRPTLSRPVTRLLSRTDVEIVVVSPRPLWPDSAGVAARVVPAVAPPVCDSRGETGPTDWLLAWHEAGRSAAKAIDEVLDDEGRAGRLNGPLIAREVSAAARDGVLVCGASNPIRDLDLASAASGAGVTGGGVVLSNRGLAGIDGTLATASGVSLARAARGLDDLVRVLVGDLTMLHDIASLMRGTGERRPRLQVVVVDDGGGGVFTTLEHGERSRRGPAEAAVFERVFGTPQEVDLAALCTGFGVRYTPVADLEGLRDALNAAGQAGAAATSVEIVHARIERSAEPDLAARLAQAVRARLTG